MIRVLLAEDQAMVRGALATLLGLEDDIEVVAEVSRGNEVASYAKASTPDIALLDIGLPVMDGWEFARSLSPAARPPIIVLSADRNVSTRAREIGALEWLAKPFELSDLLAAVRRAVPIRTS